VLLSRQQMIDEEVMLYLEFCRKAALHDEQEGLWRTLAHATFYHLEELRSVNDQTPISK
jgi:hypothetical protein